MKLSSLTSIVVTEPATTKYGEGVLYNFVFTLFPCKTVFGDVTAFHRIDLEFSFQILGLNLGIIIHLVILIHPQMLILAMQSFM